MNIHEYQGKALLKSFGAPVAEGLESVTPMPCYGLHLSIAMEERHGGFRL